MRLVAILCIAITVACTATPSPQTAKADPHEILLPVVEVYGQRESTDERMTVVRPKGKLPTSSVPCVGIDTGDPTQDVRAKLDCLARHK